MKSLANQREMNISSIAAFITSHCDWNGMMHGGKEMHVNDIDPEVSLNRRILTSYTSCSTKSDDATTSRLILNI